MHLTLADMALDLVQNSVEAGSNRIALLWDQTETGLELRIEDNGKGMDEETRLKALDPFYTDGVKHKKRKVGLGLPFLVQTVEQTGGRYSLESEPGRGACLSAAFDTSNIDLPPLGDVVGLFCQCCLFDGDFELEITRKLSPSDGDGEYVVSRRDLQDALGDLNRAGSIALLRQFMESQEEELAGG